MSNSALSIEALMVARYRCEESQLDFTRYFFKQRFGKRFVIGDHHRTICKALDQVIEGKIKRLIINIAPRYGKTEVAVKNFIARGLAINPAARFIHLSYSDDLALDNSEEVKEIVKSESFQTLFPDVQIKPTSDSKKKWYTTEGGGVYATATAGQVTGFGAGQVEDIDFEFFGDNKQPFGGALIIDDPIKPEEADSIVLRKKINARWDSTIKNRVNSRNTPIIIIMQRLHEEDLCGYIAEQQPGEWTILKIPSIQTDDKGQEFALWPFMHTLEELHKLKDENELVFGRQHMQDPQPPEGNLFQKKLIKRFTMEQFAEETTGKDKDGEEKSLVETKLGYIDPAEGGGDPLAGIWGQIIRGKVFITDVIFTTDTVDVTPTRCAEVIERQEINYTRIERNGLGSGFIRDMNRLVSPTKILSTHNSTHKETRIWNEYGFIKEYFYFLAEDQYPKGGDYDKFMRNLFAYMKVKENQIDGAPDSAAGLSRFIQSAPQTKNLFTPIKKAA